ncbi:hypothetical protein B0T24DRAFT_607288 [Lasiosphaeria ovina]|uniref:Zn(2)-C6 fungal-type domain-containing protein n=1 Tax=Lasiosphaeria ovina TaxID=92902 RepID=A0AAE0NM90_9PEZI|nr:hypothetical protein B0T24DRAFT_607288 [Lasiosphaeria ovina]
MQQRKSHTKSRRGCRNCKRRHTKCDEQGPPCAGCVLRNEASTCILLGGPAKPNKPALPTPKPASALPSHVRGRGRLLAPATITPAPSVPSPCSFSSTAPSGRLLELELMHRWATRSWASFSCIPQCEAYLVQRLPRCALRHSYLMNAILSAAAMDLALATRGTTSTDSLHTHGYYLRWALEYSTRASAEFRTQVAAVSPDNIDLLFYFSSVAAVVHFATPAADTDTDTDIIGRVSTLCDMLLASAHIAYANMAWLLATPSPVAALVSEYAVDLGLMRVLDGTATQAAVNLLSDVSRQVRVATADPSSSTPGSSGESDDSDASAVATLPPLACEVMAYQLAIGQTKYCFAEERLGRVQGYFVSLFGVAGPEFAAAIRVREPMALFVLLYWGVLLDTAARDPRMWVVADSGRELVAAVSEALLVEGSGIGHIAEVRQGIAWTRHRVALPPLLGCEMPPELMAGLVLGED